MPVDSSAFSAGRFDRGSNQSGVRAYNERLLLSLLRRHGAMAKAEIAQLTGLSAQTVSVIMRKLEGDGLLRRGQPIRVRGKVGQPSVPMSLVAEGAYFLGLKIGRRSSDLILIDFLGNIVDVVHQAYSYPLLDDTLRFALEGIEQIRDRLTAARRKRISGLGICMPFLLWDWGESIGAPRASMADWKTRNIAELIAEQIDYPVYLQNDATAACGAELVFGQAATPADFVYFYIGYFVGGGVALNGSLFTGKTGNAGALGSMPIAGPGGELRQLIDIASIAQLDRSIGQAGGDPATLWDSPPRWDVDPDLLDPWIESASLGLTRAIGAAASVIDFELALIDGWLPPQVRAAIVASTRRQLGDLHSLGIQLPDVREGSAGYRARELGAASLPLSMRFLVDPNASLNQR